MQPIVRTALPGDIPAMHRIRLAVRENRLAAPGRITEAMYRPYILAGSAWVAEQSGRLAGFAILDVAAGSVWALFVDPRAEGVGIGTALHDRLIEWATQEGLRRLTLSTAPGTRADRFYTAAGWQAEGATEEGETRFVRKLAQDGRP